jgi:hypothetical protein
VPSTGRIMSSYPQPAFREPLGSTFVYAAWSIDPVRVGPFVRSSRARRDRTGTIAAVASELARLDGVTDVRLFAASFIPPLPGIPTYDVVLLVAARTSAVAEAIRDDPRLVGTGPAIRLLATNAARFGETGTGGTGVTILFNHFTGQSPPVDAVRVWREISGWYAAEAGVDNSTLLRPDPPEPYLLINYARLPGAVVPFMLGQVLRPSFYRAVRSVLTRHRLTALPLFFRPVPVDLPLSPPGA